MTVLTDTIRQGEFLISEAPGFRSRDVGVVTVSGSTKWLSGTLLAQLTVGAATAAAAAGNTGNGTMGAVTVSKGAVAGTYRVVIIEPGANVGTFTLENPDGVTVGRGAVATAFSGAGLAFTLADGATDFVAGDTFNITVAAGTGKWVKYSDAGVAAVETAAGILWNELDPVAGDIKATIIVRDAEVNTSALTGSDAAGLADLARLGIIAR